MDTGVATVVAAAIAAIAAITVPILTYKLGQKKGSIGKRKGLERLNTEIQLEGTVWKATYDTVDENNVKTSSTGITEFKQDGSRVTATTRSPENRVWIIEGIARSRRLCYVYVDTNPDRISIGTVNLLIDDTGERMDGFWTGWSPHGRLEGAHAIFLEKQK